MTTGQRFGLNMLSAVSAIGLLRFMVVKGRVSGEQVCEFMRRLMYRAKRPVFLILDGHPMHSACAGINSGLASGTECNSIRARQCA